MLRAKDLLKDCDYCTNDPYQRQFLDEAMQEELNQIDSEHPANKSDKRFPRNDLTVKDEFKNIDANDSSQEELNYEEEENDRKRERDYEIVAPPLFKIIAYWNDRSESQVKRRPFFKMTDLYLTSNSKVRSLIANTFKEHIYGRRQKSQARNGVINVRNTSNAAELEVILKQYENADDEYNFEAEHVELDEQELEDYVIDRGDSKDLYSLYYKNLQPKLVTATSICNKPIGFSNFLSELLIQVRNLEKYSVRIDDGDSKVDPEDRSDEEPRDEMEKPVLFDEVKTEITKPIKEYFGQFRLQKRDRRSESDRIVLEHNSLTLRNDLLSRKVSQYFSYVNNGVMEEQYLQPLREISHLDIDLSNSQYFLPKLHTVLDRNSAMLKSTVNPRGPYMDSDAPVFRGNQEPSYISGSVNAGQKLQIGKHFSNVGSELPEYATTMNEQHESVQKIIKTEMKNLNKAPIKHSEVATKFELVKFTLQQNAFHNYHRYEFAFNDYFHTMVRVQLALTKRYKPKAKGLVFNVEMTDSNQKFSKVEDLSLSKGEFILVEYIEETPLLLSNVGMCQRMFVQVNYQDMFTKIRTEAFNNSSIESLELERDKSSSEEKISFQKECELWRKNIKDTFGDNGKQIYWEPKNNSKLIGVPEGPGIVYMDNNMFTVPIVRKKPSSRDFILVREGMKWYLRKVDHLYVSGQIQPKQKVFYPSSRDYNLFKITYTKAFIKRQTKVYGSVNFDQLKLTFKGETETSIKKILKSLNAESRDNKTYKLNNDTGTDEHELKPEDVCLYERMQKSLCQLGEVGIEEIKSNEKMKNVLKEFNRRNYLSQEKFAIARMIREQLQLTSWYLTDSFLKYRQKTSKIEINGFADPTNGKGGYSYINKPQKERTAKEDMDDKVDKTKTSSGIADLRKLDCGSSRALLRELGYNEEEIEDKGRWELINYLKNKEGTDYSRKERETKSRKIENQKKEISKNFNRLLKYLNDECEEPAFDYSCSKKSSLQYYIEKQRENWEKTKRKFQKLATGFPSKEQGKSSSSQSERQDADE